MPSSTITTKGQITLPKEVRDQLHLETGDRVDFVITQTGEVLLKPATLHVGELKGILRRKGQKTVTVEAMNTAITRRAGRQR